MVFNMLDVVAPTKEVKISCDDPAWMNARIKTLIRRRNREYDKSGKTFKWKSLQKSAKNYAKLQRISFQALLLQI